MSFMQASILTHNLIDLVISLLIRTQSLVGQILFNVFINKKLIKV